MPVNNPRLIAAKILLAVLEQRISLTEAFARSLRAKNKDTGLIKELCYGTLRWLPKLQFLMQQLLTKRLKAKDADLEMLGLIGLYQLLEMHIPEHAAVTETVNAVKASGKSWASGLLNAVLRNFLRQKTALLAKINTELPAYYAHPAWLLQKIQEAWPEQWEMILMANNQRPPLTLRVNSAKTSRADYLSLLTAQEMEASVAPYTPSGIILKTPVDVNQLPRFAEGYCSVQDLSAQLAAELLDLKPDQRVLDACAAPGGKTAHILETEPRLAEVVAIDKDAQRLNKITENLARLSLTATVLAADATDTKTWWDQKPFDRILLDAPCSATGIIRRHPDIKYLRREADFETLPKQQLALLQALWPLLKSGGLLVYATCSIMPEENAKVVQQFLAMQPDAREIKIQADWGIPVNAGRQLLPQSQLQDGFYYAVLGKNN